MWVNKENSKIYATGLFILCLILVMTLGIFNKDYNRLMLSDYWAGSGYASGGGASGSDSQPGGSDASGFEYTCGYSEQPTCGGTCPEGQLCHIKPYTRDCYCEDPECFVDEDCFTLGGSGQKVPKKYIGGRGAWYCVNGRCGDCVTNADCFSDKQFCDTGEGICKECVKNYDCAVYGVEWKKYCFSGPGVCGPCATAGENDDCKNLKTVSYGKYCVPQAYGERYRPFNSLLPYECSPCMPEGIHGERNLGCQGGEQCVRNQNRIPLGQSGSNDGGPGYECMSTGPNPFLPTD